MKYIILLFFVSSALAVNKYSAAVNNAEVNMPSLRTLEKPFRMAKLNLLWTKAQVVRKVVINDIQYICLIFCIHFIEINRNQIKVFIRRTKDS